MKHLNAIFSSFISSLALLSSDATEVIVYADREYSDPIVIEELTDSPSYIPRKWTFTSESVRGIRTAYAVDSTNTSFSAFIDTDGNGAYSMGEPFGVSSGRSTPTIELTETSSITPRVNLWDSSVDSSNDRVRIFGHDQVVDIYTGGSNRFTEVSAPARKCRVRVVRYKIDNHPVYKVGVEPVVVLDKTFDEGVRNFLHEGDFLSDGQLDIDWDNLYIDAVDWRGTQAANCDVTNVSYIIVYNWDNDSFTSDINTSRVVKASSTLVTRRFESRRTVPTSLSSTTNETHTTFAFRVDNEEKWPSLFGTTYTSFKINVMTISGATTNDVWNSGIVRLPPADAKGVYRYSVPLSTFQFSNSLFYRIAVYNAKFKTDTILDMESNGDPFSEAKQFE